MQQDAELHADEDKKRKELVESVNQADSLIYATEKSLKDLGDKVDEETKSNVEKEVESLKNVVEKGDNVDDLKAGIESQTRLHTSWLRLCIPRPHRSRQGSSQVMAVLKQVVLLETKEKQMRTLLMLILKR